LRNEWGEEWNRDDGHLGPRWKAAMEDRRSKMGRIGKVSGEMGRREGGGG